MDIKDKINPNEVYLSERIADRLKLISDHPLTVIEAPIGYGKTTVMRAYLKEYSPMYVWQSVMDASREYFWKQFTDSVRKIDEESAERLEDLPFPADSVSACKAAETLSGIRLKKDILLIVDDYHKVFSEELNRFFELAARENIRGLRIVLMGRNKFTADREELKLKGLLLAITESDLKLREEECRRYFDTCGISLSRSQSRKIFARTEGWMSALHIALLTYDEGGLEAMTPKVFSLLENSVYANFSDDEKDFLMRVCIFDRFTREQARFVRRKDDPSEILNRIVETNGFIRYDEKSKTYHIHKLFSKFLREKLADRDLKYRNEVSRHAADWYYLNGGFFLATFYYYKSGNFEDMLKTFIRDKGKSLSGRSRNTMIAAFKSCPEHIRYKYPLAVMIYARQLFMMNEKSLLNRTLKELTVHFDSENLTEKEKEEFTGEYYMLMSFLAYNNISRMNEYYKMAAKFLKKTSSLEDGRGSWTGGAPSVLYMFYNEIGGLDRLTDELHRSRDLYYKLTNNNGRGGEYILDGERKFFRGYIDRAEILSFKAYNVAKKYDQADIMICALFLQARIAMLQGDADKGARALDMLRETAENGQDVLVHAVDICKGYIYAIYGQLKPIESWLLDGRTDGISVYHPAVNFVYITYGRILLERDEYSRFLGCSDYYISEAAEENSLLTVLYMRIYEAIAYNKMDMQADAAESMRKAVQIAAPDELYIPFVENGRALSDFKDGNIYTDEETEFVNHWKSLYKKFERNFNILLKEDDASPLNLLTKREREIAMLVSDGRTNMQIARELNIAEITVKKSLSNIYSRLGITNRASLSKRISMNK